MPRFKPDPVATAEAGFTDHRSYVSFRLHPDTNHPCVFLKGDDATQMRRVIFEREKGICWRCKRFVDWEWGELRHLKGGNGAGRCWCPENLGWGCGPCHRTEHVQVGGSKP